MSLRFGEGQSAVRQPLRSATPARFRPENKVNMPTVKKTSILCRGEQPLLQNPLGHKSVNDYPGDIIGAIACGNCAAPENVTIDQKMVVFVTSLDRPPGIARTE